jgi:hypothetical protein
LLNPSGVNSSNPSNPYNPSFLIPTPYHITLFQKANYQLVIIHGDFARGKRILIPIPYSLKLITHNS